MNRRTFLKLALTTTASTLVLEESLGRLYALAAPESLDQLLEPLRAGSRMPALAGAVIRGAGVVAAGAVGNRQAGALNPVRVSDRFHLGSCTKSMTATLLGLLIEQGKLSWSSTVGDTFGDLRSKIHGDYQRVTLLQLLTHQSGLPEDRTPDRELWTQFRNLTGSMPEQRRRLIELALSRAPAAPPGTRHQYSNVGYTIAGAMAEQVTGQPWETAMQQQVFAPLRMANAGFGSPGTPGASDQPWGHTGDGCQPVPPGPAADNPLVLGPAGSVHATLEDWGQFVSLHLRGARGEAGLLLKPETFQQLHRPSLSNYAMGWNVGQRDWAGGTALSHSGSNTFWYAVMWVAPAKSAALLAATNCGSEAGFRTIDSAIGAMIRRYLS
jgi:CubicO group peptidase (beta-lactamase class C family)